MAQFTYASYFEVQVPMTHQQTQQVVMHQPLTNGRFQTTVNPIDGNGCAYAPGQAPSGAQHTPGGPNRVGPIGGGGTDPSDPYAGDAVPLGDAPWFIMAILALGYIAYRARRRVRARSL